MQHRVRLIAAVLELAGLTFHATGGPAYTGQKAGDDGLWTNSTQENTPSMGRAFRCKRGLDPFAIPDL